MRVYVHMIATKNLIITFATRNHNKCERAQAMHIVYEKKKKSMHGCDCRHLSWNVKINTSKYSYFFSFSDSTFLGINVLLILFARWNANSNANGIAIWNSKKKCHISIASWIKFSVVQSKLQPVTFSVITDAEICFWQNCIQSCTTHKFISNHFSFLTQMDL